MSGNHGSSAKAIAYAFFANLGIAITKGFAAVYTNSGSMLAEAIHSTADATNQVLLFIGLKQSAKPPTDEHPLGFGKATYFWSFVVALLLFSMGGLFSIYEGWHKLHEPEPLNQAWVALTVLGIAIVLETLSLLGADGRPTAEFTFPRQPDGDPEVIEPGVHVAEPDEVDAEHVEQAGLAVVRPGGPQRRDRLVQPAEATDKPAAREDLARGHR